jgi:transcriptional regulator with XRE-family HTH domain
MTAAELRTAVGKLALSQAQLARLLDVTPRAMSTWLSGTRPVPGPVAAYLRLFANTPRAVQLAEVQRIDESESTMRDGVYSVSYFSSDTGQLLVGHGVVVFDSGKLYGGDTVGGRYDGDYEYYPASGKVAVRAALTFPANVPAVFGPALPYEWKVQAFATFDPLQDDQVALTLVDGHTVTVSFTFIRELPDAA